MHGSEMDDFSRWVYALVRAIPEGRATSYGAIARALGHPTWARRVGRVMARCGAVDSDMPAHRVVNAQGFLSGAKGFPLPDLMQQRLEAEGIRVVKGRIRGWTKVFWDPLIEIQIESLGTIGPFDRSEIQKSK